MIFEYARVEDFLQPPTVRLIEFLLTGRPSDWQDLVEDFEAAPFP